VNSWHLITIYLPTYPNRVFSLHMRSPATATHPAVTAVRKFQGYENPTNAKHVPQHCREQSINVMNAVPSERRPLTTSNTCIICIIYIHNSTYIHIHISNKQQSSQLVLNPFNYIHLFPIISLFVPLFLLLKPSRSFCSMTMCLASVQMRQDFLPVPLGKKPEKPGRRGILIWNP
jgi:hypothetical protein